MNPLPKILLLCLTTNMSCGTPPVAQTLADKELSLELIASDSRRGVYRVLLCKGKDDCISALLDEDGQEALLNTSELPHSFFAAYQGYALLALAIVTAPVVGFKLWRKWLKKADDVLSTGQEQLTKIAEQNKQVSKDIAEQVNKNSSKLDNALSQVENDWRNKRVDLIDNELIPEAKKINEFVERLPAAYHYHLFPDNDTLKQTATKLQRAIEKRISTANKQLTRVKTNHQTSAEKITDLRQNIIAAVKKLDNDLATRLANKSDELETELIQVELEQLDKIFAERLAVRKNNFRLGDDGLDFYRQNAGKYEFERAGALRFLERKKELLTKIRDGHTLDTDKLKKELDKLNVPVTKFLRQHGLLKDYYSYYPKDKFLFEQLASVSEEHVPGLVIKAKELKDSELIYLNHDIWKALEAIRFKGEEIEIAAAIDNHSFDIDAALTTVAEEIVAAKDILFTKLPKFLPNIKNSDKNKFKQRVLELDLNLAQPSQTLAKKWAKLNLLHQRLAEYTQELAILSQEVTVLQIRRAELPQQTEQLLTFTDNLRSKLAKLQKEAETNKQQAQETHAHTAEELKQRQQQHTAQVEKDLSIAETTKSALQGQYTDDVKRAKISAISISAAVFSGLVAIDRWVWGYEQRQHNRHWQQLLQQQSITALDITAAQAILHSIATVTGNNINPQALSFAAN